MPPRTRNPTLTASESGSGKRKKKARTEDIPTEGGRRRLEPDGRKKKKARTEKEPTPPPVDEQNPSLPAVQETDSNYPPPPHITEDNEESTEPLQPELFFPHTMLATECIPCLRKKFREDVLTVDSGCPRMCKRKWRAGYMKGFPLEEVNDALGDDNKVSKIYFCISLVTLVILVILVILVN